MRATLAGLSLLLTAPTFAADVFDRHTLKELQRGIEQGTPTTQITLNDAAKLKPLAANLSSPCIAIKTNDGNYAKVLLGWGLRKGGGQPTPVVLLERFVTFRVDRPGLTSAAGKDVMLFPGFGFNFDIGQVVPVGQGADIEFTVDGAVKPVAAALIVPLNGSLLPPPEKAARHDPLAHDGVVVQDFVGTWKIDADGRWKGDWELAVNENGRICGTFVSEELQNRYDITGQPAAAPHQLKLDVFLANAQMQVDAYLWTKDKSQMAGTITLTGRKFGFHAVRVPEAE
ncbi:MAG: hypothetical protein SH850_30665 [Planctomycetaceae bacterium]|nr:hypothetical protein [Planctomycetaceae bacterium]